MARVFQGAPEPKDPRKGWHALRFIEAPNKVRVDCAECGKTMWLPPSKVAMYQRCGRDCQNVFMRRDKVARTRPCETCGKIFTPRSVQVAKGQGRFCSQKCNPSGATALQEPEVRQRAADGFRLAVLEGRVKIRRGEDNHNWKGAGGWRARAKAFRQTEPGREISAARLRRYRTANPDKVREWRHARSNRKGASGRLPRGTVKSLGVDQRWRCAICSVSVKEHFHLDHITPLARGGEHVRRNLQLLCKPCNLKKNAKDPIDYMRELGRLL